VGDRKVRIVDDVRGVEGQKAQGPLGIVRKEAPRQPKERQEEQRAAPGQQKLRDLRAPRKRSAAKVALHDAQTLVLKLWCSTLVRDLGRRLIELVARGIVEALVVDEDRRHFALAVLVA